MTPAERSALLATPYDVDGSEVGVGINCLALVQVVARARGIPIPDGWESIMESWRTGTLDTASGFPAGWKRQKQGTPLRDGDVLVGFAKGLAHPWCAIVDDGYVFRASEKIGRATATPASRWTQRYDELWRWHP